MKSIKILITIISIGLLSLTSCTLPSSLSSSSSISQSNTVEKGTTLTQETTNIRAEGGEIIYACFAIYNGFVIDDVYPKEYTQLNSWIIEYYKDDQPYIRIVAYDHNGYTSGPEYKSQLGKLRATTLKVVAENKESPLEYQYKCIDMSDNKECNFGLTTDGAYLFMFKKDNVARIFKANLNGMKVPRN